MSIASLENSLGSLRRRVLRIGLGAGLGWCLTLATGLLVACMWLDLALELPAGLRLGSGIAALVAGLGLLVRSMLALRRGVQAGELARRLDEAAGTRGQILSGAELMRRRDGQPAGEEPPLTAGLAQMAVERAGRLSQSVAPARAVTGKPLAWAGMVLGGLVIALGLVALMAPRLAATQWARFLDPFGDHPPYSRLAFTIDPGAAKVVYGDSLDIRATVEGGVPENVEVRWQAGDPSGSVGAEESLPMFPEPGGKWRATIASITQPARYYVRAAGGARSRRFDVELLTVPRIQAVRFRVTPPAYTNRPPYEGPLPQGGVSGLAGTRVEMWVKSNRPLAGGSLQFAAAEAEQPQPGGAVPATQSGTTRAAAAELMPTPSDSHEAHGSFTIERSGKVAVQVTDVAGQASRDVVMVPVTRLADARPFVRLLEPQSTSFATPDVTLPVQILAEDDYGVARVQLFRSLNGSRFRAVDLTVPTPPPTRLPATTLLELGDYGLSPGDVVKLFARVEDNDPSGAKGSESPITTIQIISQEQMQQMALARDGLEVLLSKYEQANRRMETLLEQIEQLQKELEQRDPAAGDELTEQERQRLAELAEALEEAAEAMQKAAQEDLPFDIDKALRKHLEELEQSASDASKAARALAGAQPLAVAQARERLAQMRRELANEREQYEKQVTDPLEHLARIYPLKEDEAQFVALYQRQRELAERMAALQETDGGDSPAAKARMRDLEEEQRQVREDLADLLQKIENDAAQLPDEPELVDLRATAMAFVKAVRESNASERMSKAEEFLAGFNGPPAHAQAQEAADILNRFISRCQAMGEEAGVCLKFQPGLGEGLGETIEQLLAAAGMGAGQGMGGAGGGYSARRSTLRNVGLYGSRPLARQQAGGGVGRSAAGGVGGRGVPGSEGEGHSSSPGMREQSSGQAAGAVPPQYRRRVGEYFQRVADELGEK